MQVWNATLIDHVDDVWKWFAHMTGTLLSNHGALANKVEQFFTKNFRQFNISWCKAPANRLFLIECKTCRGGVFGVYKCHDTQDEKLEAIQALAEFVNVQLKPGSTQC